MLADVIQSVSSPAEREERKKGSKGRGCVAEGSHFDCGLWEVVGGTNSWPGGRDCSGHCTFFGGFSIARGHAGVIVEC
ncbi:hypothetical protein V6N13_089477 [Hibiscus sabdariffa]